MAKKVIFGKELHEKAKESINLMSKSVGATLGPSGRLGLLDRGDVPSLITKDGVTVARNLLPQGDPAINLIATKIFEVANKTNSDVGDGCQDIETPILAPTGWMKMKDLEIGTEICGTNGTIQKVEAIFSKGKKRKNNITFSGGAKTHSCDDHIWTVTNSDGRTKDIKLKEMIKDYKKTSKDGNN
jgi:chaperonin GroEL